MIKPNSSNNKNAEIHKTLWEDWHPLWNKNSNTPHYFQEQHSPTKKIKNTNIHSRIIDLRLWNSMSAEQQDAALEISSAFETLTKGIGYTNSKWDKLPGSKNFNISELHADLINSYMKWAEECIKRQIKHAVIVDILCFGLSCYDCDKRRRIRKGKSKENLLAGLALYCKLRGWV